jgi:hypothetical protein
MDEPSVAVLGLPGFGLLGVRVIEGELEYLVETIETVVGYPACGTVAKAKDRREVVLRDLAHAGRPVRIRQAGLSVRRPRLGEQDLDRGLLAGHAPPALHHPGESRDLPPGRPGERLGGAVCPELRRVGWHAAWAAVVDVGTPLAEDPGRAPGRAPGPSESTRPCTATPAVAGAVSS